MLLPEIERRRAKRALSSDKIPGEAIDRVLQAGTYAPSCFNNQPWRFIAVTGDEELETVKEYLAQGNYWAKKSPCIVLVASKADLDCALSDRRDYFLFDTGLAVENLVLQAVKEGLIAHPIAGFKPVPIKNAFGIPGDYTLITLVILGFPGDDADLSEEHRRMEKAGRERKPAAETVSFNSWKWRQ